MSGEKVLTKHEQDCGHRWPEGHAVCTLQRGHDGHHGNGSCYWSNAVGGYSMQPCIFRSGCVNPTACKTCERCLGPETEKALTSNQITRYRTEFDAVLVPQRDGIAVLYADHCAEIERLRAALKQIAQRHEPAFKHTHKMGTAPDSAYEMASAALSGDAPAAPHDEHCDVNDPIIKGKPCNCRNRVPRFPDETRAPLREIPSAWFRGVQIAGGQDPVEYDVDMHYGDDHPQGDGWIPLYRKQSPVETSTKCDHPVVNGSMMSDGSYGRCWCGKCGATLPLTAMARDGNGKLLTEGEARWHLDPPV